MWKVKFMDILGDEPYEAQEFDTMELALGFLRLNKFSPCGFGDVFYNSNVTVQATIYEPEGNVVKEAEFMKIWNRKSKVARK